MSLDGLKNRGVLPLRSAATSEPRTLVVLGVARGGTSVLAGALCRLGVFMGAGARAPVFEDLPLAQPMERRDAAALRQVIRSYDAEHEIWGFKRPSTIDHLDLLHPLLRNPIYLCLFRDVLAIANRNVISMRSEALPDMKRSLAQYGALLRFLEQGRAPALLLSLEKALLHTGDFLERVIEFAGLEPTSLQLKAARKFITPDPAKYLDSSRLKFRGCLDRVTRTKVVGWAFIGGSPAPAAVELRVDGVLTAETTANRPRSDLLESGVHHTGNCGFLFEFSGEKALAVGAEVLVTFKLGGDPVPGSPQEVAVDEERPSPR